MDSIFEVIHLLTYQLAEIDVHSRVRSVAKGAWRTEAVRSVNLLIRKGNEKEKLFRVSGVVTIISEVKLPESNSGMFTSNTEAMLCSTDKDGSSNPRSILEMCVEDRSNAWANVDKAVSWTDKNLLPSANPTKTGFAFAGWKLDATEVTNGHSYEKLAKTDSTKFITLVAQWVMITGNVVSYDIDGGTPVNDKVNVENDATSLLPSSAPTKNGYTLDKWVVSGVTPEMIADDTLKYGDLSTTNKLTLKAIWKEKNYTIAYLPNNDKTIGDKTNVKWGEDKLLPTDPTKKGYIFAGWYFEDVKVGAATKVQTLIPNDDAPDDKLILTARWTERNYLVQYNSNGGGKFTPKSGVKYTTTGLLPDTAPVKDGYTFDGWYVGSTKVETNTPCSKLLTSDTGSGVTLVAKWAVKTGFTVKYNTAGGTNVSDKSPVSWTGTGLLPTTPPTRNGFDFNGWTVGRTTVTDATAYSSIAESDQTGTSVTLVANWKEKTGFKVKYSELAKQDSVTEITLTAVWIQKDNYKVTYNTDGGTTVLEKTSVKWTDKNLLPSDNPTKTGYTFSGWQYNTTVVTADTTYATLAIDDTVQSIELKAVWTKDPGAGPDISGVVKDEDGNLMENATVRLTQASATIYGTATTNVHGEYLLSNLKPGIYNLVAEKDGQTVTVIVTIASNTLQQDLVLPIKKKNSILEVNGTDTPPVVVGNLDEIAQNTPLEGSSTSLTIKLTVQKEAEQTSGKETEHKEIRDLAGKNATILYLDALLTKQVDGGKPTDIGNINNTVLDVVIPFNLDGKDNVRVYRHHDVVNAFRKLSTKPTGAFVDETCYFDESAGRIHVYAKKYSTYAISYGAGGESHQYHDIVLSAGEGGHIRPNQSKVTVREGDSAGFDFVPDDGYCTAEVKVDGSSVGAVSTYLFRSVYRSHTLSVSFEKVSETTENPSIGGSTETPTPGTSVQPTPPISKPHVPEQSVTVPSSPGTTTEGEGSSPTTSEIPAEDEIEAINE